MLCQVVGEAVGIVVGLDVSLVVGLVRCEVLSWIFSMCFCDTLTEAVARLMKGGGVFGVCVVCSLSVLCV